jgi:NAD(P)-dependent dehydrogenase (short-subunit alcohol dehydrogenase family)
VRAEQLDVALSTIAKEFGAIAILVNNAGITRDNLPCEWAMMNGMR